jgi:hypothetical protein
VPLPLWRAPERSHAWSARDSDERRILEGEGTCSGLVPASATVPTATEKKQHEDDDDQKCRGVHAGLLWERACAKANLADIPQMAKD